MIYKSKQKDIAGYLGAELAKELKTDPELLGNMHADLIDKLVLEDLSNE